MYVHLFHKLWQHTHNYNTINICIGQYCTTAIIGIMSIRQSPISTISVWGMWEGCMEAWRGQGCSITYRIIVRHRVGLGVTVKDIHLCLVSQFRTGILPLEIETGRYVPIFDKNLKKNRKRTANERICKLCRLNDIENEYHFLCVCPVYNSRRTILFEEIELKHVYFHTLSLPDKFIFVMKHCQIEVSKFINNNNNNNV